jgi:hypothetical protein
VRLGSERIYVAEMFVGLATDATVYLSRRWEALTVNDQVKDFSDARPFMAPEISRAPSVCIWSSGS